MARLPALITPSTLFDPNRIDSAAYTLTLGSEVFVTSDLPHGGTPHEGVKSVLAPGQQIRINPGQFAFLLTQEGVKVPDTAIAFISMKATFKLRGLINVSGFHVDPGWNGALLFSVYNAGPSPVVLSQGMPLFLIWFADLDGTTTKVYSGKGKSIDSELISNMSGQVFSPIALKGEIEKLGTKISSAKETAVALTAVVTATVGVAAAAISLLFGGLWYVYKEQTEIKSTISAQKSSAKETMSDSSSIAARSEQKETEKKAAPKRALEKAAAEKKAAEKK